MLNQWFEGLLLEITMIYCGTENQCTKESFDAKVVDQGATLTVVQSENGKIFGGYASKSWTKKDGYYDYNTEDDKAWLFSFDHQTQLKIKPDQK